MSTQSKTSPEGSKKLHHDLGNVLGNLKAMELLLFPSGESKKRDDQRVIYQSLLRRLEEIQSRMSTLDKGMNE